MIDWIPSCGTLGVAGARTHPTYPLPIPSNLLPIFHAPAAGNKLPGNPDRPCDSPGSPAGPGTAVYLEARRCHVRHAN